MDDGFPAVLLLGGLLIVAVVVVTDSKDEDPGLVVLHTHQGEDVPEPVVRMGSSGVRVQVGSDAGLARAASQGGAGPELPAPPTYLAHVSGDHARFEPTVETLVTWGVSCGLDPIDIRAQWASDPTIAVHWATLCESMALRDVLSWYDDEQLHRWRSSMPAITLSTWLGSDGLATLERFSAVPTEALYEAVETYSLATQDHLWGLGESVDVADVPDKSLELLRIVREHPSVLAAADYLGSHIKEFHK